MSVVACLLVFTTGILSDADGVQELLIVVIAMVLFFGPIFAGIAWGTKRALKRAAAEGHKV